MKNLEIEKLNQGKKSGSGGDAAVQKQLDAVSQDLKSKEVEIQYLETQLGKKENEIKKLKKETERMLLEQQIKFS